MEFKGEHPDLFAAQEAKEAAIQRSEDHANEAWKAAAYAAVEACAQRRETLIVDDVWPYLEALSETTHDFRALGPVMRKAAKEGVIAKTDQFRLSHAHNHGTPRPVWKSLVWRG